MNSVDQNLVFRQYLSLLPNMKLDCPMHNYGKKFKDGAFLRGMILTNLCKWENLREIETGIRSKIAIQEALDIKSISYSQFSRRLIELPTQDLSDLLGHLAKKFHLLQKSANGINPNVGILRIIDVTYIKLPNSAANWTAISKNSSGIKLHIREVAASADSIFPEKMIPSTGNVPDSEAVNHIIDADGALYVMDRGYGYKTKMGGWLERNVQILVRVRSTFSVETLKSFTPTLPNVVKNELVSIKTCKEPLRYIEFLDENNTTFRLLTNNLELSEEDILSTYKNRWYIELFFKWIKQHLNLQHLFSKSPKGICNQMFITLITHALVEIMRLQNHPKQSISTFLTAIRQFAFETSDSLIQHFNRKLRVSKGRQKIANPPPKAIRFAEDCAIVNVLSKEYFTNKEK